ncbi:MAG: hypothetical protein CL677_02130 [Bdellovibrionaceae bacterium]|nr:hypothetical protein [Pseudobdellovibrionaceae bacterium]|tara:strand:+ start:292 stop:708 length:417 start_codon:yes stop_codon:yes gene_type:complete
MNLPSDLHFLVVDDSPSIRDLIVRSINRMGFTKVDVAKDVNQAWSKIEKKMVDGNLYDFIVSDLNMPGPNGLEFLKRSRSTELVKELPFLLITTESEKALVVQAVMAGVSEYVVKPFDYETFSKKIIAAYTKHHPNAA